MVGVATYFYYLAFEFVTDSTEDRREALFLRVGISAAHGVWC